MIGKLVKAVVIVAVIAVVIDSIPDIKRYLAIREMWASPETRRLAVEGLSALEALAGPARDKLRHA